MKHALVLLLVLSFHGRANAAPADAVGYINDAIDVVDEHGGKCKRELMEALQGVRDMLKDEAYDSALRRIKALRNYGERCPARVDRLLRKARRALEEEAAPARPAGVPYSDWHPDCRDSWFIIEIARYNTNPSTIDTLARMFAPACETPGMGAATYPNGLTAKTADGAWYYPTGLIAKSADGAFYYPNGLVARSASGDWYYPNGLTAKSASWYYKNGTDAGGWEALAADACARSATACAGYKLAMNSDIDDWRNFALVQLVSRAK